MTFLLRGELCPGRRPCVSRTNLQLRRLPLGHDGIADGRIRRGLLRPGCGRPECFDFLPLDLFLRGAITQADFVLLGLEAQNLEVVFVSGCEHRSDARAAGGLFLVAIALGTPLFDFRDMAEAFNAFRQFDESPEIGGARYFAFYDVADFVFAEPIGPDVLQLLDAQGKTSVLRIHFQNFGLDAITFLEFFAGMLDALGPAHVADMDQAFHALFDFDERAEIGEVADAAVDNRAHWIFFRSGIPGVGESLLQSQGNAALVRLYFQDHDINFVAFLDDFRRMLGALRPAHFADVH